MQPETAKPANEQASSAEPTPGPTTASQVDPVDTGNRIWSKTINTSNIVTAIIVLLLLAFVDYPMAMSSWAMLGGFFQLMLFAFAVFVMCAIFDYAFSLGLRNSQKSKKDSAIVTLVMVRNTIVILNMIPLIQLLGILAGLIAPIIIIAQLIITAMRFKEHRRQIHATN